MMNEFEKILDQLQLGTLRAASKNPETGIWSANLEVKKFILEAFKEGKLTTFPDGSIDKHTLPPRKFSIEDGIRLVPTGSAVRRGSYLAKGVIVMPPSYVNVGAYIDEGTMVDSHVLVGSCAQIGKNVHLSAAVQIGGVLEPIGQAPVVIEDGAFIGAGSIVVEGIQVGKRAIIAPGVQLSKATPIFDLVNKRKLNMGEKIPDGAVVVSGTRPATQEWGKEMGLNVYCALIIKYRDEKTDTSVVLEDALR
jgi:2,3,4,5-tetrahydropyridine-2-carboxylate N-succinyltransferase